MSSGETLLGELRKEWMASEDGFFYRVRWGGVTKADVDAIIRLLEEISRHQELLGRRDAIILTWRIPSHLQIHGKFMEGESMEWKTEMRKAYGRIDKLVSMIVEGVPQSAQ